MEQDIFNMISRGLQFMSAFAEIKKVLPTEEEENEAKRLTILRQSG
jgi:hypothetical protein